MRPEIRCNNHRLRLLEISQKVSALHLAGAFSCIEIIDAIYYDVLDKGDAFILSKGHAGIAQYVLLESKGILEPSDLDCYSKPGSNLGVHPTSEIPGIYFGTGSLGHGLNIGLGAAIIKKRLNKRVFVLLSDGEIQEGSTWEGIINAPSLNLNNLTVIIDFNDFQSLGRMSETHPNLLPLGEKFNLFGWKTYEINGHSNYEITEAVNAFSDKPKIIIAKTVKGKGVSYMENIPIWHYRSPDKTEYMQAVDELRRSNEK
jgi:transketolase